MGLKHLLPTNWLRPGINMAIAAARLSKDLPGMPRRVMVFGQVPEDAEIETNKVKTISTIQSADKFLTKGSMLHSMWVAADENLIPGIPMDVIALPDDASAQAATGAIEFSAMNAQSGQISVYVGGISIRAGVAKDSTTVEIAQSIFSVMSLMADLLPLKNVTLSDATISYECKWKGETGNDIDVRVNYYDDDATPKGVTVAITAMSGGAVNPDLTQAILAMNNYRATEIINPYTDSNSMRVIVEELTARWGVADMQDGQLATVVRGSEGQHLAWLDNKNSEQSHTINVKGDLTNPWETAAMAGAAIESSISLDPVSPMFGVRLKGYMPAPAVDCLQGAEINNILLAGGSPLEVSNGVGYLGRMVTNRTETMTGETDEDYRNLNWIKTDSNWRWYIVRAWAIEVLEEGYKMAAHASAPIYGQNIIYNGFPTEFMLTHYQLWVDAGYFQDKAGYKKSLLEELDGKHGKVLIDDKIRILTQFYQADINTRHITS